MVILSVKNLTVRFGENIAVKQADFDLEKGDILALIGPNGSGKTTLVRAVLGLLPYEGGVVWGEKVRVGYVPQRFDFDRTFPITVLEAFLLKTRYGFWIRRRGAEKEIRDVLRAVGADKLINKRIGDLSGGQLQRILIAFSLIGKPDVLFFDEPSTGIDIGGEETVYNLIHRLVHETGLTIVLISHDLNVVYQHASKVVCLNKKMLCYGVPHEVLTDEMLKKIYGDHTEVHHKPSHHQTN